MYGKYFVLLFGMGCSIYHSFTTMESLVYHLHRSELTTRFFDELRSAVKSDISGERITIVIEPEAAEITNPVLLQKIEDNVQAKYEYAVPSEEFAHLVEQLDQDEAFDIIASIASYKRPRNT
jgi:hypothetical protein